jgi:hypothetical protein
VAEPWPATRRSHGPDGEEAEVPVAAASVAPRDESYNIVKEKDVVGRSKMGKQELIDALRVR